MSERERGKQTDRDTERDTARDRETDRDRVFQCFRGIVTVSTVFSGKGIICLVLNIT